MKLVKTWMPIAQSSEYIWSCTWEKCLHAICLIAGGYGVARMWIWGFRSLGSDKQYKWVISYWCHNCRLIAPNQEGIPWQLGMGRREGEKSGMVFWRFSESYKKLGSFGIVVWRRNRGLFCGLFNEKNRERVLIRGRGLLKVFCIKITRCMGSHPPLLKWERHASSLLLSSDECWSWEHWM